MINKNNDHAPPVPLEGAASIEFTSPAAAAATVARLTFPIEWLQPLDEIPSGGGA